MAAAQDVVVLSSVLGCGARADAAVWYTALLYC